MTELPSAEHAHDGVLDLNANARKKQILTWVVLSVLVGGPLIWVMYNFVVSPAPGQKGANPELPRRTQATIAAAQGPALDTPAEDLSAQLRESKAAQAQAEKDKLDLAAKLEATNQQMAADRADATRTISVLSNQVRTRSAGSGVPADAGNGGSVGVEGAPASTALAAPPPSRGARGRNPFAAGSGGIAPLGGAGGADGASPSAPARTMSVIRASAPDGAASSPGGAFGATAAGRQASEIKATAKSSAYVTSTVEVYDSARFVPPNAYAPAKVLVGVDAAAGTSYSADPKPVMFRLMGPAVHVGSNGKFQTTDLTGCVVNGAAYAELSSEKVYIKLQKITCPVGANKFSVATVEGYVASRGKAGVRGQVVSREGAFTRNALIAGTLQGLGKTLSATIGNSENGYNTSVGSNGLLSAQKINPTQLAEGSIGGGVANASSMLADYYIKRAEQYQPVIEMPTGIGVDLVFLTGFEVKP